MFTSVKIAKIQNTNAGLVGMWGKRKTYPLLMGMQTDTTAMEIGVRVASEMLEVVLPCDPAAQPLDVHPTDPIAYYSQAQTGSARWIQ